jgi:hypothetical protein
VVGEALFTKAKLIKELGNQAVHSTRKVVPPMPWPPPASCSTSATGWRAPMARPHRPDPSLRFLTALLPKAAAAPRPSQTLDQLQKLEASCTSKDHDYNEAATRDLFIDLLLKEAGWALDQPRDREFEVQGMPNNRARALWTTCCGAAASRWPWWKPSAPAAAPRRASSRPACMPTAWKSSTGHRPVIYGTNGYEHWMWDDTTSPPRPVQGFHTRDELELMAQRRTTRKPLATCPLRRALWSATTSSAPSAALPKPLSATSTARPWW